MAYEYYDYDHLDAVIFRDEKSYEECDTKVDMSWAEHSDPFFSEDEWCILQLIMVTNAVKEVKQYSYCPYKILGSESDVQKQVDNLNANIRQNPHIYHSSKHNGCSVRVLSFLWGSIDSQKDISAWERIHSGMISLKPDGTHYPLIESDPFSVTIIFPSDKDTGKEAWIHFDSVIVPSKWQQLSSMDFTEELLYNPFRDQVITRIDYKY